MNTILATFIFNENLKQKNIRSYLGIDPRTFALSCPGKVKAKIKPQLTVLVLRTPEDRLPHKILAESSEARSRMTAAGKVLKATYRARKGWDCYGLMPRVVQERMPEATS